MAYSLCEMFRKCKSLGDLTIIRQYLKKQKTIITDTDVNIFEPIYMVVLNFSEVQDNKSIQKIIITLVKIFDVLLLFLSDQVWNDYRSTVRDILQFFFRIFHNLFIHNICFNQAFICKIFKNTVTQMVTRIHFTHSIVDLITKYFEKFDDYSIDFEFYTVLIEILYILIENDIDSFYSENTGFVNILIKVLIICGYYDLQMNILQLLYNFANTNNVLCWFPSEEYFSLGSKLLQFDRWTFLEHVNDFLNILNYYNPDMVSIFIKEPVFYDLNDVPNRITTPEYVKMHIHISKKICFIPYLEINNIKESRHISWNRKHSFTIQEYMIKETHIENGENYDTFVIYLKEKCGYGLTISNHVVQVSKVVLNIDLKQNRFMEKIFAKKSPVHQFKKIDVVDVHRANDDIEHVGQEQIRSKVLLLSNETLLHSSSTEMTSHSFSSVSTVNLSTNRLRLLSVSQINAVAEIMGSKKSNQIPVCSSGTEKELECTLQSISTVDIFSNERNFISSTKINEVTRNVEQSQSNDTEFHSETEGNERENILAELRPAEDIVDNDSASILSSDANEELLNLEPLRSNSNANHCEMRGNELENLQTELRPSQNIFSDDCQWILNSDENEVITNLEITNAKKKTSTIEAPKRATPLVDYIDSVTDSENSDDWMMEQPVSINRENYSEYRETSHVFPISAINEKDRGKQFRSNSYSDNTQKSRETTSSETTLDRSMDFYSGRMFPIDTFRKQHSMKLRRKFTKRRPIRRHEDFDRTLKKRRIVSDRPPISRYKKYDSALKNRTTVVDLSPISRYEEYDSSLQYTRTIPTRPPPSRYEESESRLENRTISYPSPIYQRSESDYSDPEVQDLTRPKTRVSFSYKLYRNTQCFKRNLKDYSLMNVCFNARSERRLSVAETLFNKLVGSTSIASDNCYNSKNITRDTQYNARSTTQKIDWEFPSTSESEIESFERVNKKKWRIN